MEINIDSLKLHAFEQTGKFVGGSHSPFYCIKRLEAAIQSGETNKALSELETLYTWGFPISDDVFRGYGRWKVYIPETKQWFIITENRLEWYYDNGYKPEFLG